MGVGRSLGIRQQGNFPCKCGALALAPAWTAPTYLCILAVLLLRVLKPEQGGCTSELRYSENSATMASWTGATSGWTWGGGYDDEAGDEEAEMEQSRVRAAL